MKTAVRDESVEFAPTVCATGERLVGKFLECLGDIAAIRALILINGHFRLSLSVYIRTIVSRGYKLVLKIIKDFGLSRSPG